MQSKELLLAVINDSHSTPSEQALARDQLYGNEHQAQQAQDRELESYLIVRGVPQRSVENLSLRRSLSTESQTLLDDISSPVFGNAITGSSVSLARPASLERLTALLERTNSDVVKREVASAIGAIRKLIDLERTNE